MVTSERKPTPAPPVERQPIPPPPSQPVPMQGVEQGPVSPTGVQPRARPVRGASSALSKALNMAGKKLFGPSPSTPPSSHQHFNQISRRQIFATPDNIDPIEEDLLAGLEDLAQKAHVLTRWADEMFDFVKAIPTSEFHHSPDSSLLESDPCD